MAAAYLLRYCTDEALELLRNIAASDEGFASAVAPYTIKGWEEGDWHLDPGAEDEADG